MAASSSTAAHYSYDVFINHRGPDVKKTFASHLYHGLLKHGLRVFLDEPEMQAGDSLTSQIESAVRTASVHVAVFSPRYAESSWCLDELLLMLESGKTIIPVFYHVMPSELRWTHGKSGKNADALQILAEKMTYDPQSRKRKLRYNSATIEQWRNGLSSVAEISGFEMEKFNGDEGELVEKVVTCVLKRMAKTPLHVAKYPKGLDEKVQDFENEVFLQQQQQSENPPILGIVGLGGVGKTTLAKELFNRKSSDYSKCCFLPDVRDNSGKGNLISLQRKFLKVFTGSDLQLDSENIETLLKKHLSSSQIFVVLDDVDHVDQVDALLPDQTVIRSDSLVLITSRYKDILTSSGIENSSIYKLTGLNEQHSRELLCSHAFKQPYPPSQFESFVNKFSEACGGLPLSLKVFGSLLCGRKDESYWEDQLDKLRRILPNDIKKSLQISVDALDDEEREIFLDIACFFIGEDKDMAVKIWDACNWKGFQNLEERCIVQVDSENVIHMHDHLRDMGRDIAKAPGLVRGTDNLDDLLQPASVITEVRGITTVKTNRYDDKHAKGFSEVTWHRGILQIPGSEDGLLERILTRVHPPNLIWLRWYNCPYSSLPPWIPMQKLRVLQVHAHEWTSFWEGECQVPLQLRELHINCVLPHIPNSIGRLKYLELIKIDGIVGLNQHRILRLPEEFCQLQSLKTLLLRRCAKMKSLPDSFGDLRNLQSIDLSWCWNLERLPETFGNLIKLKYLNLSNCSKLTMSSETLGNISTLEHINFQGCRQIEVLPFKVANQRSLEELNLFWTNLKEFPNGIGELGNLKVLRVGSPLLDTLPSSLGDLTNLKTLSLFGSEELKSLPASVGRLTQLTMFRVQTCPISELPHSLGDLRNLKTLELTDCKELKCLPASVGLLTQLTELYVCNCPISELPPSLGDLRNLRKLWLHDCNELKCLPASVGQLSQLTELHVRYCSINELPTSLGDLRNLKTLELSSCKELKCLPASVGQLAQLNQLSVCYCPINELPPSLGGLRNLKTLELVGGGELEELPGVEHLRSLQELSLGRCVKVKNVRGLVQCTKLHSLSLRECSELEELEGVEHCTSLRYLNAHGCPNLRWGRGVLEQLQQRLKGGLVLE